MIEFINLHAWTWPECTRKLYFCSQGKRNTECVSRFDLIFKLSIGKTSSQHEIVLMEVFVYYWKHTNYIKSGPKRTSLFFSVSRRIKLSFKNHPIFPTSPVFFPSFFFWNGKPSSLFQRNIKIVLFITVEKKEWYIIVRIIQQWTSSSFQTFFPFPIRWRSWLLLSPEFW